MNSDERSKQAAHAPDRENGSTASGDADIYRILFETSGTAIYLHDEHGAILDVNDAACEQTGYRKEALRSMAITNMGQ